MNNTQGSLTGKIQAILSSLHLYRSHIHLLALPLLKNCSFIFFNVFYIL